MKKHKLLAVVTLITMLTPLFSSCAVKIGVPEVKEGRFDFSVTYEVNGEEKTYTGVYVCAYDGVLTTFLGSSLEWTGYIENEEEIDVPIQTNEDGVIYINFGFFPEYFMGEPYSGDYEAPKPNLYMIYHSDDPEELEITSEEEIIAGYGVKIIDYEYAKPIENTFEESFVFSRFEPSIN